MVSFGRSGDRRIAISVGSGPFLLAAIVALTLTTCAFTLSILVHKLDRHHGDAELASIRGNIAAAVAAEAKDAFGTGRWDDAVRYLYGGFDSRWAMANISGPDITYILDDRGETLFSRRSDGTVDPPLRRAAPQALAALLRRLPHDRAAAARLRNGIGQLGLYRGRAALFGAMPILPLQGRYRIPDDHLRYLVYVEYLDQAVLDRWSRDFQLGKITVVAQRPEAGSSLPLWGPDGKPIAWLACTPNRPGRDALWQIMPALIAAAAALIALTALLVQLLRRQASVLLAKNAEQNRLTDEANQLRGKAETALGEADRSRRLAEDAARRAGEERERHAREMKTTAQAIGRSLQSALSATVADLVALADGLDRSADHTSEAMRSQARHADEVRRRTASSAQSLEDILRNTESLATAIAAIHAEAGRTREAISSAAKRSSNAADANAALLRHVATIGEATSVITNVAEQTNLLALNATIEAARNSADSRGFAVVAAEIKALARDTRQSTVMIERRVAEIVEAVRSSVAVSVHIDEQLRQVHGSIANAAEAAMQQEVASSGIRSSVAAAREQARAVDDSVGEMAGSIADLARSAELSRGVSGQVRARALDLRGALDQTVAQLLEG